ncbi:D-alanyl-D-alanine carboxypeptidase [Paracoccus methylovorus]|uniref:D-alanyl-D-alanine carboxypeptidase n=1 Tax=Paracoccus methylovorus TaxID=2812658 RepID=A0ABX7JL08_9RHOB|nr:serine hydrolase [Paracoccus methylovorus]QRZ14918.1 D-alanyl-D-alanine carboxypeptidase [Paracoccus methylovorus]
MKEVFGQPFEVLCGRSYAASAWGGAISGSNASTVRLMVNWYSDQAGTRLIEAQQIGADCIGSVPSFRTAIFGAPGSALTAKVSMQVVSRPADAHVTFYGADIVRAVTSDMLLPTPYTPPEIGAYAAICVHLGAMPGFPNTVLFKRRPLAPVAPASLTKVLTAIVALRVAASAGVSTSELLKIEAEDEVGGSGSRIVDGDILSFGDALKYMLMPSSNNASMLIARVFGGLLEGGGSPVDRFVKEMNRVAEDLGMSDSRFKNPSGLGAAGQVTTMKDISALMIAAAAQPEIMKAWRRRRYVVEVQGKKARHITIRHTVPMVSNADVLGGKSGTLGRKCYNAALLVTVPTGNTMVVAVSRAESATARYSDLRTIIDAVVKGHDWPVLVPSPRLEHRSL